jgi:RHS repeat-associated protein
VTVVGETNRTRVRSFLWGTDLSGSQQGAGGVGGLLAVKDEDGTDYFVGMDGNGNVAALVHGTTATVSATYEYGPFGEVVRGSGAMARKNPFRFSTKYQDDETDLLYYGYRYYSASLGRWLSRDPMEERGGHNLYGFVQNDPGFWFDALGLAPEGIFMITAVNVNVPSRGGNVPGFQVRYVQVKGNCSCPKDKVVLVQVISHDSNAVRGKAPHFDGTNADDDNNRKQGIPPPPYPATGSGKGDGGPLSYKDAPYTEWYTDYTYSIEVCAICRQSGKDAMLGCARFTWTNKSHKLDPSGPQEATNPSSLWNDALKKWTDAQPK